jgi:hypothetical protein
MSTQINLRISEKLFSQIRKFSAAQGFENIQDFIRETIRERIYGEPELTPEGFELIRKLIKVADERKLYGTEEELFKKLRS